MEEEFRLRSVYMPSTAAEHLGSKTSSTTFHPSNEVSREDKTGKNGSWMPMNEKSDAIPAENSEKSKRDDLTITSIGRIETGAVGNLVNLCDKSKAALHGTEHPIHVPIQRCNIMFNAALMRPRLCQNFCSYFNKKFKSSPMQNVNANAIGGQLHSANDAPKFSGENNSGAEEHYNTAMETVLLAALSRLKIANAVWTMDREGRMYQVTFTMPLNEDYEYMLNYLSNWGFGERNGSMLTLVKCLLAKHEASFAPSALANALNSFKDAGNCDGKNKGDARRGEIAKQKQNHAWQKFMDSVRSRLNVAQIVREVRRDASISFDSVVLVFSAALLTAMGLIDDNFIFLVSSMLISPLMGPIIAAIFGTVIRDRSLRRMGQLHEILGLLFVTVLGFIFGLCMCAFDGRLTAGEGITYEMLMRTETRTLWLSVIAAIPSGAAAAIGILAGNISSIIGVAISASLLPPAVNAGMLWAFAAVSKYHDGTPQFKQLMPHHKFAGNEATELLILGAISMLITIFNVVFVYLLGVLVLKAKEIAPLIASTNQQFWKHDIKVARQLSERDTLNAGDVIIEEFANLPSDDQRAMGISTDVLRNLGNDIPLNQNTWSPSTASKLLHLESKENAVDTYITVHRLECLYASVMKNPVWIRRRGDTNQDQDQDQEQYQGHHQRGQEHFQYTNKSEQGTHFSDEISEEQYQPWQYPHISTIFPKDSHLDSIVAPTPGSTQPQLPHPPLPILSMPSGATQSNSITDTAITVIAERGGHAFIITPVDAGHVQPDHLVRRVAGQMNDNQEKRNEFDV